MARQRKNSREKERRQDSKSAPASAGKEERAGTGTFLLLQFAMLIFSLSNICSKMAGEQELLSPEFILWFGGLILTMGLYALIWQQVLKRMPLMTAYANTAVVILWGLLWGRLFFQEPVSLTKVAGAAVAMAGVYLMVTEKKEG